MRIVVTGGGSGGHITPILAVATALKQIESDIKISYIGQTGDTLGDIPAQHPAIDDVFTVRAGKYRRYHGEGLKALFDVPTIAKNVRDVIWLLAGTVQSFFLLGRLKPAVIFTRGGYVSVPVALAGKLRGIPYITHDSDSTPSLANRIIARWAAAHAVALPIDLYPYPAAKTVMVGVPVNSEYKPVTPALRTQYLTELDLPSDSQILLVTGGGNGAQGLNDIILANAQQLLQQNPKLTIVHSTGRALEAAVTAAYDTNLPAAIRARVLVRGFVTDLHRYSGAADVIIARGGATNLAEFAIQRKACVIIPSPQLIWNVRNSQALADLQAIVQLTTDQAEQEGRLAQLIHELLQNEAKRQALANTLAKFARPHAARDLAELILQQTTNDLRSGHASV